MQSTLTAFVVGAGAGAQRHPRLEEETSLDWRRAQTARLLLPWPRVRARRVGRPSRHTEWRQRLGLLIDAMDRSVEDLGPEPPAWWQRGQPMQLTMAAVAEHVAVQEDIAMTAVAEHVAVEKVIASMAAEPAGDEAATAGDAAGDGAGDDKPAEPCTKRRKTHVPPEVKEWFCSLTRVKPDLDHDAVPPLRKEGTPILLRAPAHRHTRRWFSHKTPGTALGRPRSLEPVSRVCSRVCCGAGVLAELLNAHLETLGGVQYRFSERHTRRFMRSLGYSFKKPKGELEKEWPEATTRTLRAVPTEDRVDIERCWNHRSQPHHKHRRDVLQDVVSARTRVARRRRTARRHGHAPQHHRVPRHQASRASRVCPTHFSGQDLPSGTLQPLPNAAHHVPLGEPFNDDDDPHSLPHMAGQNCHETRGRQCPMDLLHGSVYRARQPRVPGPPSIDSCPHPARLRAAQNHVCQPLDRAYMRPFKAALGRYSPRYIGRENPTPTRRRCQHHPQHCWHA